MKFRIILLLSFISLGSLFAETAVQNGNVPLPAQLNKTLNKIEPSKLFNNSAWKNFVQNNGEFNVLPGTATGSILRAFGKPIKIDGYNSITNDNVSVASLAFLTKNADALKINPSELSMVSAVFINNKWYVRYKQIHNGIEVLLSEAILRITPDAKVFAFGAEFYNNISIQLTPAISSVTAMDNASAGLNYNSKKDMMLANEKMFILPVKNNNTVSYHLVYKVDVNLNTTHDKYFAYVDAQDGKLLWRQNTTLDAVTKISAEGQVKKQYASDNPVTVSFPNLYLFAGGNTVQLDVNGQGQSDFTDTNTKNVSASMSGKWANLTCNGHTNASFAGTLTPGTPYTLSWNDNNSDLNERCIYYYINYIHDYVRALDTAASFMDFQMKATLDWTGSSPNAASNGKEIYYMALGASSMRLGQSPAVLYHEYGHSISNLLFESLGVSSGMTNGSAHEGTADAWSCLVMDDPDMAKGIYTANPTELFRTINNDNIYPDSVSGESHHDGLIIGGAFWDLRKSIGVENTIKLLHFAKYGLPDDPDVGLAYGKWLLEVIIADDDDGDLSNGTPHLQQILYAFNKHHIGIDLFIPTSFIHTPLANTKDTVNPYIASFEINQAAMALTKLDSAKLYYSTDNFRSNSYVINAIPVSSNKFTASIPAQKNGTSVSYYITMYSNTTGTSVKFMQDNNAGKPYRFLVGEYFPGFTDDFENYPNTTWKIGVTGETAYQGAWQFAKPNEITLQVSTTESITLQPGTGHSGNYCFVTGPGGSGDDYSWMQNVPIGRTSIVSPDFDLTQYPNAVIKFQKWFYDLQENPSPAAYKVAFSSDHGTTWVTADSSIDDTEQWVQVWFKVSDYVNDLSTVQVKITVINDRVSGYYNNFCEGLMDDFEILTTSAQYKSVNEQTDLTDGLDIYPNPSSGKALFTLNLAQPSEVNITLVNMLGEQVANVYRGNLESGSSNIQWESQSALAPGMYFARVYINGSVITRKIIIE